MRKYNHKISEKANESLRKREVAVRRQKGILAIAIIVVVALGILLGTSMNALASSDKDIASYNKYYVSIRVESGDTLWTIADEYVEGFNIEKSEYIEEVCQINAISKNDKNMRFLYIMNQRRSPPSITMTRSASMASSM